VQLLRRDRPDNTAPESGLTARIGVITIFLKRKFILEFYFAFCRHAFDRNSVARASGHVHLPIRASENRTVTKQRGNWSETHQVSELQLRNMPHSNGRESFACHY
jgi:hypothetical protein